MMSTAAEASPADAPSHATPVLLALILAAAVANLNLAVANVGVTRDRQGVRRRTDVPVPKAGA